MNELTLIGGSVRSAVDLGKVRAGALVCAWTLDAATGALVCAWTAHRGGRALASPVPWRGRHRRAA